MSLMLLWLECRCFRVALVAVLFFFFTCALTTVRLLLCFCVCLFVFAFFPFSSQHFAVDFPQWSSEVNVPCVENPELWDALPLKPAVGQNAEPVSRFGLAVRR